MQTHAVLMYSSWCGYVAPPPFTLCSDEAVIKELLGVKDRKLCVMGFNKRNNFPHIELLTKERPVLPFSLDCYD